MSEATTESTKFWSQICAEADPDMEREDKTAYQFSNGRRFEAPGVLVPEA